MACVECWWKMKSMMYTKNFSESLDLSPGLIYNISIIRYIKGNKKNSKKYLTIDIGYSTI